MKRSIAGTNLRGATAVLFSSVVAAGLLAPKLSPSALAAESRFEFKDEIIEVSELPGRAHFTVIRTPPLESWATVKVRIVFGEAGEGRASADDIHVPEGTSAELTADFSGGESEARGFIGGIVDDGLPEGDETLSLNLVSISGPGSGVFGARTNATVILKNGAPSFTLHGTQGDYGAVENASFAFDLWRHGDTNVAVSVEYRVTTNSTAVAGVDFGSSEGRVTFAPGEKSKQFLTLRDNGRVSSPVAAKPVIELELFNPSANATILDPKTVQLQIRDNETPETVDFGFSPAFDRWPGLNFVAVQPDGKVLVAGSSLFIGGRQRSMARLNPDGSLDESFQPDLPRKVVASTALLPSGKILTGFDDLTLVQLLPDGRRDPRFSPSLSGLPVSPMVPLSDGRVLLGRKVWIANCFVLKEDGSEDRALRDALRQFTFTEAVPLADGKLLLLASGWVDFGPRPPPMIRVFADGSHDPSFKAPENAGRSTGMVLPLSDGTILAQMTDEPAGPTTGLARLLADGSVDPAFKLPIGPNQMRWLCEKDGWIYFWNFSDLVRMRIDGTLDGSFSARFDLISVNPLAGGSGPVLQVAPHGNGLLGWGFSRANYAVRPLARIVPEQSGAFYFRYEGDEENMFPAPTRAFEEKGEIEISVARAGDTSGPASVRYRTRDDSAIAGQHYTAAAGLLEFAPFQTEAVVRIALRQDEIFGGRPRFFLELHDPAPAARLDHPRPIAIHDSTRGLVPGRLVNRLDGKADLEFDATGLAWREGYEIESSVDLRQWTAEGCCRQIGPIKGSFWITYKSAPESIEISNSQERRFFRISVP